MRLLTLVFVFRLRDIIKMPNVSVLFGTPLYKKAAIFFLIFFFFDVPLITMLLHFHILVRCISGNSQGVNSGTYQCGGVSATPTPRLRVIDLHQITIPQSVHYTPHIRTHVGFPKNNPDGKFTLERKTLKPTVLVNIQSRLLVHPIVPPFHSNTSAAVSCVAN